MDIHNVTQKCVPIADCMSQLINAKMAKYDPTLDLQIADITMAIDNSIDWNQIRNTNMIDPIMARLARVIQ